MSPKFKKRSFIKLVAIAAVAIAVAVTVWQRSCRNDGPGATLGVSGTVEATEVQLGFPIGGRLAVLDGQEGETVTRGTQIALLDQAELRAKREQARAVAAAARSLLAELEHGSRPQEIRAATAARDAAKSKLAQARRDQQVTSRLYKEGAVTGKTNDDAMTTFEVAATQLEQAEQQLKLFRMGTRSERIQAQRDQVAIADSAIAMADAALAHSVITAPIDGVITVRHRERGEIVAPGSAVVTLMNPRDRWVRIYIAENRMAAVRLGTRAILTSDTYPDVRYAGEVVFIASQAEFTPKNVQTQEERVKLVYAVKVKITRDPDGDLKPGMPVDVELALARPRREMVQR